jgi:hypothetical protein
MSLCSAQGLAAGKEDQRSCGWGGIILGSCHQCHSRDARLVWDQCYVDCCHGLPSLPCHGTIRFTGASDDQIGPSSVDSEEEFYLAAKGQLRVAWLEELAWEEKLH